MGWSRLCVSSGVSRWPREHGEEALGPDHSETAWVIQLTHLMCRCPLCAGRGAACGEQRAEYWALSLPWKCSQPSLTQFRHQSTLAEVSWSPSPSLSLLSFPFLSLIFLANAPLNTFFPRGEDWQVVRCVGEIVLSSLLSQPRSGFSAPKKGSYLPKVISTRC